MYHVSSLKNRNSILSKGLIPSSGIRRCFGNELLDPAIFLTLSEPFDTTFDDDIYFVNCDYNKMIKTKYLNYKN